MEDNHPHVALGVEEVHDQLALVELEVVEELVELVEELEELDDALLLGSFALGFLREVLPLDCAYLGCGWQWLDLILEGHVAPQVLVLHVVVVEGVEPRRLVCLDVVALALPLGDIDVDDVLARRIALVDDCHVEDCELLDGLGARLDIECLMSVYLRRRRYHRCVESNGSIVSRKKW